MNTRDGIEAFKSLWLKLFTGLKRVRPQRIALREKSLLAFIVLVIFLVGNGCIPRVKNGLANLGFASYVLRILGTSKSTISIPINANVETPTFTPPGGNYTTDQSLTLNTTTTGATIYYTLDGTTPTASSTAYTGAISITGNGTSKTIKAIAVKAGMADSVIGTALYTIQYGVAVPIFTPVAGLYLTPQNISISTTTVGANIYYTTDGTTPTTSSTLYSAPFHIWGVAGKTIKAIATKTTYLESEIVSGVYSYPPIKTGQTVSSSVGDDGNTQLGVARSYIGPLAHVTYTTDYTTTDNVTGLVWKTCSQGKSGSNCATGTAATLPNDGTASDAINDVTNGCNALNSANSGNGYSGIKTWRLPTRQELETLPDYGTSNPTINTTAFPGTVPLYYWNSTASAITVTDAWLVSGSGGDMTTSARSSSVYVRCVSGQPKAFFLSFKDSNDGTIRDNTTGLIWQKCSRGQNNDATCTGAAITTTWATAITYCNGLSLAGKIWRLPHINEFKTIVDTTKSNPAIDFNVFPSTDLDFFWSSTTFATSSLSAWYVAFTNGNVETGIKTNGNKVRCVTGP
jgi:hypothetical protein